MRFFYLLVITQIVTESLPISSSGHVALLEHLFQYIVPFLYNDKSLLLYTYSYDLIIRAAHIPMMIIVVIFFSKRWLFLLRHAWRLRTIVKKIIIQVCIAGTITSLWYVVLYIMPHQWSLTNGFIITGCLLYATRYLKDARNHMVWWHAIILGCVQGCALLPGISRFASVYVTARWLGLAHRHAFEITFAIVWPLFFAASMHAMYSLYVHQEIVSLLGYQMVVIFCASTGAWWLFCAVERMAQQGLMWWFGVYMIIPILLSLV